MNCAQSFSWKFSTWLIDAAAMDNTKQEATESPRSKARLPQPVVAKAKVESKAMPVNPAPAAKLGSTPKPGPPQRPPPEWKPHETLLVSGPPCTVFSQNRPPKRPVTPPKAPPKDVNPAKATEATPVTPAQGKDDKPVWKFTREQMELMKKSSSDKVSQSSAGAAGPAKTAPSPVPMMQPQQPHQMMPPMMAQFGCRPMMAPVMAPMQTMPQGQFQGMQPTMMQQGPAMVPPVQPMQPFTHQAPTMAQPTMMPMVPPKQSMPEQPVQQQLSGAAVERFCEPSGLMNMRQAKASTARFMEEMPSGSAGSQTVGATYVPAQPRPWSDWNEESKKAADNRGHRHTPAQVRREAFQREAQLREHFEAKLAVQKEWYEAKLMESRAEVIAAKAIMLLNGLDPNQTLDQRISDAVQPPGKKAKQAD